MYSFVFFELFLMRDDNVPSVHNIPSSPFRRDIQLYSFDQERNRRTLDPIGSKGEENMIFGMPLPTDTSPQSK